MAALRVLAIAVASSKAACAYMQGSQLLDWRISVKAAKNEKAVTEWVQTLITELKPDVVVTEKLDTKSRKGRKTKRLIKAVIELASHNYVLDVSTPKTDRYKSKFEEAEALAKRYPELQGRLPKRKHRFFDFEPRAMVLFEAVSLAEGVIFGPPERLAAAMG